MTSLLALQTQSTAAALPGSSLSVWTGLLQRKCACGGEPGLDGECAACRARRLGVQPKLTVSAPDDGYEQEAERIAAAVVPETGSSPSESVPTIRKVATAITPIVQRQQDDTEDQEEEKPVEEEPAKAEMGETTLQRATQTPRATSPAPSIVHATLKNRGQPLDHSTRTFMENRFGHDFGQVRVHTDAQAVESARVVNALAYTVGNNLVFGAGQYTPDTDSGLRLLAHELTHVVQQTQGPSLQPAMSDSLKIRSQRDSLEQQAPLQATHALVNPTLANVLQRQPRSRRTPTPPAPTNVCGPNVTTQFRNTLRNIETTFRGWSRRNKLRACQRVLIPITPDLQPDINGWDTLPLFQGRSNWLRRPPIYRASRRGPCATPTSSDPTNPDPFAAGHEDPNTCSNTVQFENECWLNGSVNYATFGVMVRLCESQFSLADIVQRAGAGFDVPAEAVDAAATLIRISRLSMMDWAELLIRAYKAARGSATDSADLPVAWVRSFYTGGSSATAPGGANRARCRPTCGRTGSIVRWDWVWEPVKPRSRATPP